MLKTRLIIVFLLNIPTLSVASERIRLNQIGFCIHGPKTAIVISPQAWNFSIRSTDGKTTFYTGELSSQLTWNGSAETLKVADFSPFKREGSYVVYAEGCGSSFPFTISDRVYSDVARSLIKAFYYQRASTDLPMTYAGKWSRSGGHYDRSVIIHPSAASDPSKPGARKAGEVYPSPRGWYDAGDYGKYVVNSGITTYSLLLFYEQFPDYCASLNLTIPESGNAIPDILDEIKWQLDWLLTMQDPADGGVYHKVTDKNFIGDLMPAAAKETRYFIGKGSAATFDFIGVCAMAYRIYKPFLPAFADSCLNAAEYAWGWGSAHQDSAYRNPEDVVTGEYGNTQLADEFYWAAMELFIATGDSVYYTTAKEKVKGYAVPSWPGVSALGGYSLALVKDDSLAKKRVISIADPLVRLTQTQPYRTTMSNNDFYWGSNGVAANQGMSLIVAYLLTKDPIYLRAAIHAADYLLGRNATGYCFVTGYGSRPSMNPHHRPSVADNIPAPVPGFLVGGPNASSSRSGENCGLEYPKASAKAYLDLACSFTTNEVAINWNAPAAFLAGAIDAIITSDTFDSGTLLVSSVDTVAPEGGIITVASIKPDQATVSWIRKEPLLATVSYSTDAAMKNALQRYVGVNDSPVVRLAGLRPDTHYFVTIALVDRWGNRTVLTDTFSTVQSPLYDERLYTGLRMTYPAGTAPKVSIAAREGAAVTCFVRNAPGTEIDTIPLIHSGSEYSGSLPATSVGGICYSVQLVGNGDTLVLPVRSLVPDTVFINEQQIGAFKRYSLISVPGLFPAQPSKQLFSSSFGSTDTWRYYGYQPENNSYVTFDTLRSGTGGWMFNEKNSLWAGKMGVVPPDSLFPVLLNEGWNCIGNPYTFPIYWNNTMIDHDGVLVNIADSLAKRILRRQFFTYRDTTADMRINGSYLTNRNIASHLYNDSSMLEPWQGYWVYAEKNSVRCLLNPLPVSSPMLNKKKSVHHQNSWTIECTFSTGSESTHPIAFGCSEAAEDRYDPFDTPCPPQIASPVQAVFRRCEWGTRQKTFIGDIRSSNNLPIKIWSVDVTGEHAGKCMKLQWKQLGAVDGNLFVQDDASGETMSMNENAELFMNATGQESRHFTFVYSKNTKATIDRSLEWQFSATSGRTCVFSFVIPLNVSGMIPVTISVFDSKGKKIAEPFAEKAMSGKHSVVWSRNMATGYYIATIGAGSFRKNVGFNYLR